jgi:predicted thioredoxin/glutaredoxin
MEGTTEYRALSQRVLAVAVEGAAGDWAAYVDAVIGNNHEREAPLVAEWGGKLSRELAELLFREWKHLKYRW